MDSSSEVFVGDPLAQLVRPPPPPSLLLPLPMSLLYTPLLGAARAPPPPYSSPYHSPYCTLSPPPPTLLPTTHPTVLSLPRGHPPHPPRPARPPRLAAAGDTAGEAVAGGEGEVGGVLCSLGAGTA